MTLSGHTCTRTHCSMAVTRAADRSNRPLCPHDSTLADSDSLQVCLRCVDACVYVCVCVDVRSLRTSQAIPSTHLPCRLSGHRAESAVRHCATRLRTRYLGMTVSHANPPWASSGCATKGSQGPPHWGPGPETLASYPFQTEVVEKCNGLRERGDG